MKISRNIGAAMAQRLTDYSRSVKREANRELRIGAENILELAKANAPDSTGALKASGLVIARQTASGSTIYSVEFGGEKAPYALYVHEGTLPRSKMPPFQNIVQWVEINLGLTGKEARRVAFAIARSIKQGQPPNKFLERAFRNQVPKIYAAYKRGVRNAATSGR